MVPYAILSHFCHKLTSHQREPIMLRRQLFWLARRTLLTSFWRCHLPLFWMPYLVALCPNCRRNSRERTSLLFHSAKLAALLLYANNTTLWSLSLFHRVTRPSSLWDAALSSNFRSYLEVLLLWIIAEYSPRIVLQSAILNKKGFVYRTDLLCFCCSSIPSWVV